MKAEYSHFNTHQLASYLYLRTYRGTAPGQNELNGIYLLSQSYYKSISPNVVLVLNYGESNAMGSAINTWQMPQTAC